MEAESGSLVDIAQEFSPTKCAEAYPSGIQTHEVDIQLGQASTPQDNHDRGKFLSLTATTYCSTGKEELYKANFYF